MRATSTTTVNPVLPQGLAPAQHEHWIGPPPWLLGLAHDRTSGAGADGTHVGHPYRVCPLVVVQSVHLAAPARHSGWAAPCPCQWDLKVPESAQAPLAG